MRIIVTGCAGFVGSHLVKKLLQEGHTVIGVDNLSSGKLENIDGSGNSNFIFIQEDIRTNRLISSLHKTYTVDGVVHLAAIASIDQCVSDPELARETNYFSTIRMHEEAKEQGINFVFAGSAAEYSIDEKTGSDINKVSPEYVYAVSKKLSSDRIVESKHGTALRFFNIYGPGQNFMSQYAGVISIFIRNILQGKPLHIFGDGHQTRDFIYIRDIVDCICLFIEDIKPGARYDVGTGKDVEILHIANTLIDIVGKKDIPIEHLESRKGDIFHSRANIGPLQGETGYRAKTALRDGLGETLQWFAKSGAFQST